MLREMRWGRGVEGEVDGMDGGDGVDGVDGCDGDSDIDIDRRGFRGGGEGIGLS